ncbi:hypothetical protein FJTKL_08785 [Diaporthe vaccinii]|uniref:Uncharacterized protein n=1 Tax=Diaporthe vaccinii TaxID=105482 RepID=A0ABR4EQJ6_9PEZI
MWLIASLRRGWLTFKSFPLPFWAEAPLSSCKIEATSSWSRRDTDCLVPLNHGRAVFHPAPSALSLWSPSGLAIMLRHFKLPHLLPLAVATAHAVGGLVSPLVDAEGAILMFGLPQPIAESPAAQIVFPSGSIRTSAFGVLVWVFYLQRKLDEVDTVNLVMGIWLGLADAYVCWMAGVPSQATFKATAGLLIAGWGAAGLTST